MVQFYDNFLAILMERYPHKPDLVNALIDVLRLEKESIYRRLRKDVYFSAEEMMRISGAWNISLDNIVCSNPEKTRPFQFKMIDYVDPGEDDYNMLEQYNHDLALVAKDPDGRMFEVLNSLPRGLYCRSEHLTRFFTMKWLYKNATPGNMRPFSDIHVPERMRELDMEHIRCIHSIPEAHSVHDKRMFENAVNEIAYFRSIGLLNEKEVALLRDELLKVLNYVEDVTVHGTFPVTGKKMFFYLSHTWIETEYVIYVSKYFNLILVKILERDSLLSTDRVVIEQFLNSVQSVKRSSVLMSESNVLQQSEFFSQQRKLIMAL